VLIAERFTATRGEMLGWYSSSTLAGRTIAPLTGGIVISYFASSAGLFQYQAVYLIAFAAAIPVFILTLVYREEHRESPGIIGVTQFRQSFTKFFSDRYLRATALVDMATYFSFGAFETFLPIFLVAQGFAVYEIGLVFSIQVVLIALTKPFFGRVADRIDKRKQILAGVVLMGLSVGAIPFLSQFWEFMIVSILTGLGISLSTVATAAFVADVCGKKQLGASMGALSSIMDIGHSGGPLVTGIVIALINFQAGFLASLVVSVVIAVVFVISVFPGKGEVGEPKRAC
jgi:MFS family permease